MSEYDNSTETVNLAATPFPFLVEYIYIELVIYIICFTTNVFGNTLTLVATWKFAWLREKSYTTLVALTIADLLIIVKIPMQYIGYLGVDFEQNLSLWISLVAVQYFVVFNAFYHVILLAADRFLAVVWPFFYESHITKTKLWCASLSVSAGSILLASTYTLNLTFDYAPRIPYIMDIVVYFIAALMLFAMPGKITHVARKHQNQISAMQSQTSGTTAGKRGRKVDRATRMMLAVLGFYLLLWFPYYIKFNDQITFEPSYICVQLY